MNDEPMPDPTQPPRDSAHPVDAADESGGASVPISHACDDDARRAGPPTEPQSQFGPPTAGGMLRNARQAQGVDLASLAAMLKIDPKPVLALLPAHERNTLERVSEGINTPFRDGQGSGGFELPSLMRPGVVIVVLLIVGAIALFLVPESWLARATHAFASGTPASAPADPAAPAASAAASVAPLSAVAVSATAAQGIDEVLAHVAAAPNIPLQVIASADSWVEVVDAQGHSLLSRTVVAGESVGLDGALPMRVKIGNAKGTHLKLRGDNVDLTPWTRDNVARLELK